jgi:Rab proteins geranylgeranyltransferase component A
MKKILFSIYLSFFSDLIHLVCETIDSPIKDLQPYINLILKTTDNVAVDNQISTLPDSATENSNETDKNLELEPTILEQNEVEETIPTILWSLYFKIPKCNKCEMLTSTLKSGVHICCGPHFDLDYDRSIAEAKAMFNELYPNEEFLPRAPDPEEIIYGDEDESKDGDAVNLESIKTEPPIAFDENMDECADKKTDEETK